MQEPPTDRIAFARPRGPNYQMRTIVVGITNVVPHCSHAADRRLVVQSFIFSHCVRDIAAKPRRPPKVVSSSLVSDTVGRRFIIRPPR
jgi:hypothetical protein